MYMDMRFSFSTINYYMVISLHYIYLYYIGKINSYKSIFSNRILIEILKRSDSLIYIFWGETILEQKLTLFFQPKQKVQQ